MKVVSGGAGSGIILLMFLMDLFGWWYGAGFKDLSNKFKEIFESTMDFFSINDLAKSLFKPFRETLTTSVYKRTLFQKLGDAFISRAVGFVTRFFLILIGGLSLILEAFVLLSLIALWPFIPFLPFILVLMTVANFGF